MPAIGPEKWQALSPYLDQALEIAPAEREAWLATLRKQNPTLAADLRTLLKEHHALDEERFLQLGAATPLGPPSLAGQTQRWSLRRAGSRQVPECRASRTRRRGTIQARRQHSRASRASQHRAPD